jgi:phosphatidylserine decarboxylase
MVADEKDSATTRLRVPLAREGYPLIGGAAAVALVLFLIGGAFWGALGLLLAAYVASFFRDPERDIPADAGAIVAPADGRVIKVEQLRDDRFLGGEAKLISIFMSPLNVHINRVPVAGRVVDVRYNPGKYFRAFADKASLDNEQNAILLEDDDGRRVCFVQIAGFVARRIVCHLRAGMRVERGQRCGLIMFGSRADVYLPADASARVEVGARVHGGSTILAEWS